MNGATCCCHTTKLVCSSARYQRGSPIVTSNKRFLDWGEVFNDQVLATAILDCLLHHATTLNIKCEGDCLKAKRRLGLLCHPKPVDAAEDPAPDRDEEMMLLPR